MLVSQTFNLSRVVATVVTEQAMPSLSLEQRDALDRLMEGFRSNQDVLAQLSNPAMRKMLLATSHDTGRVAIHLKVCETSRARERASMKVVVCMTACYYSL